MAQSFTELANLIWAVAERLRGDYRQSDYGKVILPFTLLRRLDCVLEGTKDAVLAEFEKRKDGGSLDVFLKKKSQQAFYNTSVFTLPGLLADPNHIRKNLTAYLGAFSADARDIFERFKFMERVEELDEKNLLFQLVQMFANVDLHPETVPNETMGLVFEELIRKFAEASNETAGEHFTPREVIHLIVQCLFAGDDEALAKPGVVRSMYDPTAGTGGILSVGGIEARNINSSAKMVLFGQELNDESYAICKADMLIKGQDPKNIVRGNTLSQDGFPNEKFDYGAANPPFGVDWKKVKEFVDAEHSKKGFGGRFGPGLPRVSDGSMLFPLHLISKMRPAAEGGGRIGIVLNGSPLFTGDAGSGESEIRRWILENDLLEAIVALPNDLFYNTGIATYVWLLSNHKKADRKGKVQLIDATRMYAKMKKSLGNKRVLMTDEQIAEIVRAYSGFVDQGTFENEFKESKGNGGGEAARITSKVFNSKFFGYRKVTVDRPPQPGKDVKVKLKKGQKPYDPDLRDTENIPLTEDIGAYMKREVLPHVPDAYVNTDVVDDKDKKVGKVGYEINFTRHFYRFVPARSLETISKEIYTLQAELAEVLGMLSKAAQSRGSKLAEANSRTVDLPDRHGFVFRVPEGWNQRPLKFVAELNNSVLPETTPPATEIQYVDISTVGEGALVGEPEAMSFENAPSRARRIVKAGDSVISTVRTYLKATAHFAAPESNLIASTGFALLTPQAGLVPKFLHYATRAPEFIENVVAHSEGVSYPAINPTTLGTLYVPVPPAPIQRKIVDYLDAELELAARIRTLNAKISELLDEYQNGLLSYSVTGAFSFEGEAMFEHGEQV